MIKINGGNEPEYLSSELVISSLDSIEEQVQANVFPLDIPGRWGDKKAANTTKKELFDIHKGKCCYCEKRRNLKREMDVEHYRPKKAVAEDPAHQGYWWLAYIWDNYLWSCKSCNQEYKRNHFPLLEEAARAKNKGDDLSIENPCILNPRKDNPREYFYYFKKCIGRKWFIRIMPIPGLDVNYIRRANDTIKILGLNRGDPGDDLVTDRGDAYTPEFQAIAYGLKKAEFELENSTEVEAIEVYERVVVNYRERLKSYVSPKREFSGFFRWFLDDIGIDYADLVEDVA